jgi:hypothetical protein
MSIFIFLQFFLLLILVIGGGLAWIGLYRRIQLLDEDLHRFDLASITEFQDLRRQVADFADRIDTAEAKLSSSGQRQALSVNYTQRSHAIRLIRRGESAEVIARTIGVPPNQIRLLMKLQTGKQIGTDQQGRANAAGG